MQTRKSARSAVPSGASGLGPTKRLEIVTPPLFEKLRLVITQESFLLIEGELQQVDHVISITARQSEGLRHEQLLGSASHDFH